MLQDSIRTLFLLAELRAGSLECRYDIIDYSLSFPVSYDILAFFDVFHVSMACP